MMKKTFTRTIAVCIALAAQTHMGTAQEQASAEPSPVASTPVCFSPVQAGAGEVRQYVLTLDRAVDGQPLALHLWTRDGTFRQAWATSPAKPGYCYALITSHNGFYNVPPEIGLQQEGDKLTGAVRLESSHDFQITTHVAGSDVTGEFQAFPLEGGRRGTPGPAGRLTGKVLSANDLAAGTSPLAKGAYVAGFRHDASGVGFETGQKLVENPQEARVVWKSEVLIFPPYHEGINFSSPCGLQGGHASPVLYEDKLYLNYFWGVDSATDDPQGVEMALAKAKEETESKGRAPLQIPVDLICRKYARTADEALVCIDAGTGKTLWRSVFPGGGWNITRGGSDSRHKLIGPSSKGASHLTPCAGDGLVFFKGTAGVLYALDATTGELRWQDGQMPDPKTTKKGGEAATDTVQFADGVVATLKGGALAGFEAKTGRMLWQHPGLLGGRGATALRWVASSGLAFFLTTGGYCLEPKTGKTLWKIEDWEGPDCPFAASGELLFVAYERGIAGYRISSQQADKLWENQEIAKTRMIFPVMYKDHAYLRTSRHPVGIDQELWSGSFSPMKDDGRLTQDWLTLCIEMKQGTPVGAAYGSKSYASITAGDGRIFNCCAATVAYQDADPKQYRDLPFDKQKGAYRGPADHGSPCTVLTGCPETGGAYVDGRFFSRQFDGIVCYDLRTK